MDNYKKRKYAVTKYQENEKKKCVDLFFDQTVSYDSTYVSDFYPFQSLVPTNVISGQNLCVVQQGYTQSQRIGNKIALCSLELRLYLVSRSATTYAQVCKLAVVYDRSPNGEYPSYTDIYSAINPDGTTSSDSYNKSGQPPNVNNMDRFVILYDELWPLPNAGPSNVGCTEFSAYVRDVNLDLGCVETLFNGNVLNESGCLTISNLTSGSLLLIIQGDILPTEESFSMVGNARLWFKDC